MKKTEMTSKLPISVAMVIHNEEKLLPRALESVIRWADEIVIVHDGACTDSSLAIAKKYNAKIYEKSFVGNPEPHRPFSIAQCKNDWVFILDADEYPSEQLAKVLHTLIEVDTPGYDLSWYDKVCDRLQFTLYKQALFRKSQIYFIGAPFEYAKPNTKNEFIKVPAMLINDPGDNNSNYKSLTNYLRKYKKFALVQAKFYLKPFRSYECWNYHRQDWDMKMKLKIRHPILFGVIGMSVKYFIHLCFSFLRQTPESFSTIIRLMIYNQLLFTILAYMQVTHKFHDSKPTSTYNRNSNF